MGLGIFRFLLALLVVASHTPGYSREFPDSGTIGVATFFFISGYLMPASFERHYRAESFWEQTLRYLANRLLRIYPIYWAALFATYFILQHIPNWALQYDFDSSRSLLKNIVLLTLNQSSWWGDDQRFIGPAWTLDVELQFYLLVPILILTFKRWPRHSSIIGILVAAMSILIQFTGNPSGQIERSLIGWFFIFLLGLALYFAKTTPRWWWLAAASAFAILGTRFALSAQGGLAETLLTAATIFVAGWSLYVKKKSRFDELAGDLSYPLFVIHNLTRQAGLSDILLRHLHLPNTFWTAFAADAIAACAAAAVLLISVDYPVHAIRKRLRTDRLARPT